LSPSVIPAYRARGIVGHRRLVDRLICPGKVVYRAGLSAKANLQSSEQNAYVVPLNSNVTRSLRGATSIPQTTSFTLALPPGRRMSGASRSFREIACYPEPPPKGRQ
jgi:hypothetical protein